VRKYLRVLAGLVALCAMSWAQAPTSAPDAGQTPAQAPTADQTQGGQAPVPEAETIPTPAKQPLPTPPFPRIEFFAGGTYAEAGFFNAGHWAGLYGWDASLGANATRWLGFVAEGGEYFGTSQIPTAVPAPFPTCPPFCPNTSPTFSASTREYNFLFGAHLARRKWENWTPFGELLFGHQGVRGQVIAEGTTFDEVGTGRALVAGGGLDHQINRRYALRLKADYFESGTAFPLLGKQKQDNFRFSMGIVIRNVRKKKRTLEDETQLEP
jgi:hypothetical protein